MKSFNSITVKILLVFAVSFIFAGSIFAQNKTKVVAHRGHWDTEGSYENTITALKMAHEVDEEHTTDEYTAYSPHNGYATVMVTVFSAEIPQATLKQFT